MRFGTEEPRRRRGQTARVGEVIEIRGTVASCRENLESRIAKGPDSLDGVDITDDVDVEQAAGRGADTFAVVRIHRVTSEYDRTSPGRIRCANQRAGVAG